MTIDRKVVTREQVRALLHVLETPGTSVEVSNETLAALCRAWLAVDAAPTRMVGSGISYGVSVAGTGISNGQRVRIVIEPKEPQE